VLWHCWLGDRKGIRPVKRWVLVCWRWQFDWRFARLTAPVVTITSIIISSNKVKSGDILVSADPGPPGKRPLKRRQRKTAARQVTNRIPTSDLTSLTWSNLLEKRPAKWKPKAVKHYCMEWVLSLTSLQLSVVIKLQLNVLAEATAVIVHHRTSVTECLQQRVYLVKHTLT